MAVGRPTSLTPDVQRRIVEAIQGGNYQETAALYGGIDEGTYYRWMARGKAEEERIAGAIPPRKPKVSETLFREFRQAIIRARAEVEVRNVAELETAAKGGAVLERTVNPDGTITERRAGPDWRANAWWLERSFPKKWGRTDHVELTGAEGGPLEIAIDARAELTGRIAAMTARLGAGAFAPPLPVEIEEAPPA